MEFVLFMSGKLLLHVSNMATRGRYAPTLTLNLAGQGSRDEKRELLKKSSSHQISLFLLQITALKYARWTDWAIT